MKNNEELLKELKINISAQKFEDEQRYRFKDNKIVNINKFKRFLTGAVATILVTILGITAYAFTTKKINLSLKNIGLLKVEKNYEDNATIVEKKIETDFLVLELESVSSDNTYLIFQYKVNLKEKALEEINYIDDGYEYEMFIEGKCFINDVQKFTEIRTDKISDSEYQMFQTISIRELKQEELDISILIDKICINHKYETEIFDINKEIKTAIKLSKNKSDFNEIEQKLDENQKLIITDIGNSKFETYITAKFVVEGLTYEEYHEKYEKREKHTIKNFVLTDENNEMITTHSMEEDGANLYVYKLNENGIYEDADINNINFRNDIVKIEKVYRIILEEVNELSKAKLYLISGTFTDRKEDFFNAIWYPVYRRKK